MAANNANYVRNGKRLLHFANIVKHMRQVEIFSEEKVQIINLDGTAFHMTEKDAKIFLDRYFQSEYSTTPAEREEILKPPPAPEAAVEPKPIPDTYSKRIGPDGLPLPT